ncbi:hypothetical protein F441_22491 [Phytophthora nicotianae CJ01A1]|uniref:Uncharacterized protein n=1 Tax=Phytophthora nicotianae CJ01A1 TaxID=1317063 RepID=W2VP11_PHYNI|nr:hypothetical protein F441_22491 [Phytophthora nicotianae CJ01A1]
MTRSCFQKVYRLQILVPNLSERDLQRMCLLALTAVHPPQQYALEQGGPFRVSKTSTFATIPLVI